MKCENKRIVGYWHYGVLLTYIAAALGVVGICFSALRMPGEATICLLFSGLCDAFDGVVARTRKNRTDGDKAFGVQIDSLSDLIAFGVAPVMIGYAMGLDDWYFIMLYAAYVLCALIRLAYYNATEIERQAVEEGKRKYFEGVPVTEISLIMPIVYFIATMFTATWVHITIFVTLYVVYAVLMVIRVKIPKPGVKGVIIMTCVFLSAITAMFLVRWFVIGVHAL